jgi:rhodanese-related sulfurtransferase
MNQLTPIELREWIDNGKEFTLVDVRENWERDIFHIGGVHIAMSELWERKNEISKEQDVVLYCEKGIRSSIVIQRLEEAGYKNLFNLTGGMKEWKKWDLPGSSNR